MKNLFIGILIIMSGSVSAQEAIQGLWQTGRENTKLKISLSDGEWVGKIKFSDNEKVTIGKVILKDLKKQNEKWMGKLFVVKKQKWYDVEITPDKTKLNLTVSTGFFEKEIQWSKVE